MADPLFASVDDVNDLLSSFDLDSLLANAPKEEKAAAARCVRPMYLATMRPKRAKEVDVNDANFAVISDDILLFNDDPSVRFENGTDVIAMDEDTGARKRATVLRDLGMGVYEVQFHHTKLKQTCYATLMSKAPARVAEAEVEVLDTAVTLVEDERGMTVTTTMTLRNSKTKKEYNQSTTETRAKPKQAAPEVPEIVPAVAPAPKADAKSGVEFEHCLNELFQTERDFACRLEAVLTFYEKPIEENGLLPPTARTVVFGNGSIAKLLALSQRISEFPRNKPAGERIAAYRGYLAVAREYLADQIASRSLGHVPLQSYLQSNTKFRKFAFGQVKPVEDFLASKGIATHGHLGSVLYGPVQRLPRVMLLVDRLRKLDPSIPETEELLVYVRHVLSELEGNGQ